MVCRAPARCAHAGRSCPPSARWATSSRKSSRGQRRFTPSELVPASSWCPRALASSPTRLTTWSTCWPAQTSATGTPSAGSLAPLAASATGHPQPWTAVSSCAAAGASTHPRQRWWSGAAASFAGAAPSSASSAGTWWRCTAAAEGEHAGAAGGCQGTARQPGRGQPGERHRDAVEGVGETHSLKGNRGDVGFCCPARGQPLAPGVPSAPVCSSPSTLSPASLGFLWFELFF